MQSKKVLLQGKTTVHKTSNESDLIPFSHTAVFAYCKQKNKKLEGYIDLNISVVSQGLNVTRRNKNFPTCWASWVTERVGWPIVRATHLHIPQDHPCVRYHFQFGQLGHGWEECLWNWSPGEKQSNGRIMKWPHFHICKYLDFY